MAEEKDKKEEYRQPSPTPYEVERSLYGRAHPDFRKGEVKTEDYKPEQPAKEPPKEEPPKEEEKAIEAVKPAAGYRTRAQKPASE